MIAALYARKSTDDSARNTEARSTQRQIDSAKAYAKAKGWTVDDRFVICQTRTPAASGSGAGAPASSHTAVLHDLKLPWDLNESSSGPLS